MIYKSQLTDSNAWTNPSYNKLERVRKVMTDTHFTCITWGVINEVGGCTSLPVFYLSPLKIVADPEVVLAWPRRTINWYQNLLHILFNMIYGIIWGHVKLPDLSALHARLSDYEAEMWQEQVKCYYLTFSKPWKPEMYNRLI